VTLDSSWNSLQFTIVFLVAVVALSGQTVYAGTGTPQLTASPSTINFGSVPVGSTQGQPATLTNTGSASLVIQQTTMTGRGFTLSGLKLPLYLRGGQSASCNLTFAPQSTGNASGTVSIVVQYRSVHHQVSTTTLSNVVSLSGAAVTAAGSLAASPASISFGNVQVGSSQTANETLTNSGSSSLTVSSDTITGAGFSVSGLSLPTTLNAGQSYTFSVIFAPKSSSAVTGSTTFSSNASNPSLGVTLSGTGTSPGQLAVSPGTMSFGNVVVGTSQSLSGSLSASGSSVTVSSATSNSPEFVVGGLTLPVSIGAGQSIPFTVTFKPQASGSASANLSFGSNASATSLVESLTGSGTAAPQHSVSLSWSASTSTVAGYDVYRGTVSGGPYSQINSALDASTSYTDNTVQAGQTYYYVVTAVAGSNNQSTYSNQVQAVVPTP
jgi:Abnormal spindle-like microcephaly-assoc'd, ASPM-SPD-2-Hydin/HYDIN/CFA65/VesB-like, Ig-like domain